jgi:hypothetical protein
LGYARRSNGHQVVFGMESHVFATVDPLPAQGRGHRTDDQLSNGQSLGAEARLVGQRHGLIQVTKIPLDRAPTGRLEVDEAHFSRHMQHIEIVGRSV